MVVESIHVATFNLLFDFHETSRIYSERRLPAALALLREREADLIALQEVTPASLAAILAEPWVRERYCVSSGPAGEGVDPYGVVLLSRWPLTLVEHRFSAHKALLLARLEGAERPLICAVVHLTSNSQAEAGARRAEQLAALGCCLESLAGAGEADVLVLGDFNFGDGDDAVAENQQLAGLGLIDVWQRLRPHEPGFTFDPLQNPLAAVMSRRGLAARYDRVLVRGRLDPIDVGRFADRPFARDGDEERYASDHFGVGALLEFGSVAAARIEIGDAPVHTSALVLLPPLQCWPAIQEIRREHDPSFVRWMPHVNLIYGFVPESRFAEAAEAIAVVLRDHPPFTLRLGELRRFDHRGSTTVWCALESEPTDALLRLQAALQSVFPACREQSERGAAGFTPHLTVAKLRGDEARIAATVAALRPRIPAATWTLDDLALISRRETEPFAIREQVCLGSGARGPVRMPVGAAWPTPA
ncbi:MAG: 2'-5' RNA ligase family protein, partial [Myxococcales bacterium]|nr:2'-5' RNA ligase family protein [Myxococcales bacterium]